MSLNFVWDTGNTGDQTIWNQAQNAALIGGNMEIDDAIGDLLVMHDNFLDNDHYRKCEARVILIEKAMEQVSNAEDGVRLAGQLNDLVCYLSAMMSITANMKERRVGALWVMPMNLEKQ